MSGTIYTRGGDTGQTSLVGGSRVPKNSARVEAYGTVDETNSAIGLARASLQVAVDDEARLDRMLHFVQNRLFNCSSILATPEGSENEHTPHISPEDVARLEGFIDELTDVTGEVDHFVLPGGAEEAARLHVARTVARRAERRILDLAADEPVDPNVIAFVNRLSDLLFAAARYANAVNRSSDAFWEPEL